MERREQHTNPRPEPRSRPQHDRMDVDHKTIGMAADAATPQKRFLVIRNGRGILADGDDLQELERNYQAAAEAAPETPRNERAGWLVHTWPTFASLARCDHESQTGKVCIVDSIDSPDAVTSYYGKGFTH